jgi:lipoprotein-releasing system ATP-binding protein
MPVFVFAGFKISANVGLFLIFPNGVFRSYASASFGKWLCLRIFEFYPAEMALLVAQNIHKRYGTVEILKGVDVRIEPGEVVSIVGSSGAGKSTLLHILGTLDKADAGTVVLNGTAVTSLNGTALANFRNQHIGFVFQFHHLLPEFTALENVCIPGWIKDTRRSDVKRRAEDLLALLGLKHRLHNKPAALSGGEQQRVAVARALINQPVIVFADEPTGNLDSANARDLHQLFFELRKNLNQTFLIVTHNEELAQLSDRILHMKDGKII